MRGLLLALMASGLAACTTAPPQPMARTADAEAELQKLLAGKAAGTPVNCLPSWRRNDMVVIDDNTVVFRNSASRVYRNDFRGGTCDQLGSGWYTLVTKTTGSGLCSGDIARVVDIKTGITVGSCTLGDFVPYTRAS